MGKTTHQFAGAGGRNTSRVTSTCHASHRHERRPNHYPGHGGVPTTWQSCWKIEKIINQHDNLAETRRAFSKHLDNLAGKTIIPTVRLPPFYFRPSTPHVKLSCPPLSQKSISSSFHHRCETRAPMVRCNSYSKEEFMSTVQP